MSKVDLQRIRVTGFKRHYRILMQELHNSGIMQICDNAELSGKSLPSSTDEHYGAFDGARTQFAIDFLSPYQAPTSKLDNLLSGGKLVLGADEAATRLKAFTKNSDAVLEECSALEDELVRAQNELAGIPAKLELVTNLKALHGPVQADFNTAQTTTWVGKIPAVNKNELMKALAAESNLIDLSILGETKLEAFVRVTTLNTLTAEVEPKLQTASFEAIDLETTLGEFAGSTPAQIKSDLNKQSKALTKNIEALESKAKALSVHVPDLKILAEHGDWDRAKNEAQSKMFLSEKTFSFEAWVIGSALDDFKNWVKNAFVGEVVIEAVEPPKGEEAPVLLSNRFGVSSFEAVTEMYGLPQAREFDPTPLLAPFFLVFFGLCLSDVGYGLILTLMASFFLVLGKFSKGAKTTLRLLLYCGLAAIVGGVLLGGYFGMTPAQMPFLANGDSGLFYGQMLTPTEGSGPITFLMLSLLLGVIHLFFGMMINFAQQIKNKDYDGAFFDTAVWMFMLGSLGVFALADVIGVDKTMAKYAAIGGAVGLVLTQGRAQKNWFLKPVFGLLGLYNITNYLSDLLSYSRIMALGLATGVVGFAMNLTAGIFSEMMPNPILGIAVATFVVLLGHFLNFSLSLLGAFIHSGRLQFIEFFGKYYEGGGTKFTPFVRQPNYLTLEEK